ncbi:MAG: hypothetical protein KDB27_10625 [Planctomycetales bacterium]|nr:hypothetical protein [Planctomycetales bacterium]
MSEHERKPFRYSIGCFVLGVTLISTCLASCIGFVRWVDGEFEIATIHCGHKREIVITAGRSWEVSQPIYYRVCADGEAVVPTTHIDSITSDSEASAIRFAKFTASDGNLVGITYADDPSQYLIVHDFSTNTSFPRNDYFGLDDSLDADENHGSHHRAQSELEDELNASREQ